MEQRHYAPMVWDRYRLEWGRHTFIMGIVNVTPDSFAGDGLASGTPDQWAAHAAEQAIAQATQGAHIIDIGGASTRPGATSVPLDVEFARAVPAIRACAAALPPDIPISIDTTSAVVAQAALDAGARIVNDISGLFDDPTLAELCAAADVPLVLMANRRNVPHHDAVSDVTRYLAIALERALAAGIAWDHLILDPGFGFGNTPAENIALIRQLDQLLALGRPLLLGASRKSTLGKLIGDAPVEERLEASLAAEVAGILHGAAILRVHDVLPTVRAAKIADAIVYGMLSEFH